MHLLIVEPNSQEATRLESVLQCLPDLPCTVHRVPDAGAADDWLKAEPVALMLLGLETARAGADDMVVGFREQHPWLPILVIASDRDPAAAERLIRCGAQEVIGQDELLPDLVGRAIRHALARQASEMARRTNEDLLRLVADNTTDLIAVLDRDGRRLYNNPSYARFFGSTEALAGTDSFAEVHPEDRERIRQLFRDTLATGQGQRAEFRLLRPGGEVRQFESVGSVARDAEGRPDRVIVVSRDLTEKRQILEGLGRNVAELRALHVELQGVRRKLAEADRLASVTTFAGALAHDVKDTLQTLFLGLDFLRAASMAQDAGAAGVIEEMNTAVRKAEAAVRSLIETAHYGPPAITDHELNALVAQCADAVLPEANARRVRLERQLGSKLPTIRADGTRLRHVLLKMLLDAIQSALPGGQVRLRTGVRGATAVTALDAGSRTGSVLVEIDDRHAGGVAPAAGKSAEATAGSGGPKPLIERTMLRHVVEGFGGRLEEQRGAQRGSRISLLLPAASTSAPSATAAATTAAATD